MDHLPWDTRLEIKRGCVGNTIPEPVNLVRHVSISTSAQAAGERIQHLDALSKEKADLGTLGTKGRTPVIVKRMRPFLGKYPDRQAARLLDEVFHGGV